MAGHGKSGKNRADWSIEALGDDVVTLIEELNLSHIILIGHSLGGDVILEIATKIPDRIIGFVGIDNFKNAGTAMPPVIQNQIDQALVLMQTNFPEVSEDFARQSLLTPATDPLVSSRVLSDYKNFTPQIGIEILKSSFSYFNRERELLQQLALKMYLIIVDYFPINEQPLKLYPNSGYEIMWFHGTCHYPMIENPNEFNQLLEKVVLKIANPLI